MKKSDDLLFEELGKIAKREGIPMTELIRIQIREYVKNHKEGNETIPLDKFEGSVEFAFPTIGQIMKQDWLQGLSEQDFKDLQHTLEDRFAEFNLAYQERKKKVHDEFMAKQKELWSTK